MHIYTVPNSDSNIVQHDIRSHFIIPNCNAASIWQ